MTENQDFGGEGEHDLTASEKKTPNRTWIIVAIGAVLVMCLCIVVAFIIIDPFDLSSLIWGSRSYSTNGT